MATVSAYRFSQLDGEVASARVEDVLSAAFAQAEQIRAEAQTEGFAAGRAEAHVAFVAEASPVLAALGDAARTLNALGDERTETLAGQAAELAIAVVEQILSARVAVDPTLVLNVCRGALRRISDRQRVVVLANPEDLELLTDEAASMAAELGGIERFEVQADRRIDRGGVVVRTDQVEIDASLATQLSQARDVIESALLADAEADVDADDLADGAEAPFTLNAPR